MSKPFELVMGALGEPIEVQLRQQGLTLGSQERASRMQHWADAITDLGIQGLLTGGERERARRRLMREIRLQARPLPRVRWGDD